MADLLPQLQMLLQGRSDPNADDKRLRAIQELIMSSNGDYSKLQKSSPYRTLENNRRALPYGDEDREGKGNRSDLMGRLDAPDLPSTLDVRRMEKSPTDMMMQDFVDMFGFEAVDRSNRDPKTQLRTPGYVPTPRAREPHIEHNTGAPLPPQPLDTPLGTLRERDQEEADFMGTQKDINPSFPYSNPHGYDDTMGRMYAKPGLPDDPELRDRRQRMESAEERVFGNKSPMDLRDQEYKEGEVAKRLDSKTPYTPNNSQPEPSDEDLIDQVQGGMTSGEPKIRFTGEYAVDKDLLSKYPSDENIKAFEEMHGKDDDEDNR